MSLFSKMFAELRGRYHLPGRGQTRALLSTAAIIGIAVGVIIIMCIVIINITSSSSSSSSSSSIIVIIINRVTHIANKQANKHMCMRGCVWYIL